MTHIICISSAAKQLVCAIAGHAPDNDGCDGQHCQRCNKLLTDAELNEALEPPSESMR
jgi:hypothetical protein